MDNYISMAHETDINAFVITLKAEDGRLTYTSGIDCSFLDSIQPDAPLDLEEMLLKIKNEGIFVVGRIYCFYDDTAPRKEQGMAVRTSGVNWLDYNYHSWLSPYSESARDYLPSIATEAARMGVDEIQLYDVAFPVQGKTNLIEYGVPDSTANRTAALTELLTRMNTALKETGTFLSVVMDYASIASEENKTGQDAAAFAGTVDVLCPELFPSSFARGVRIGGKSFAAPDAEPGGVVRAALESLMKEPGAKDAVIRPWLQGFTASWLGEGNFEQDGEEQIGEQTLAADDVTGQGWLVWEGDARYSADSLR
jgi:hypothetical protein